MLREIDESVFVYISVSFKLLYMISLCKIYFIFGDFLGEALDTHEKKMNSPSIVFFELGGEGDGFMAYNVLS